jgi:hypothetical protein
MTETGSTTLQIRVETLPAVYSALVAALGELELSGSILNALISKHVSAACVLCNIQVPGDDLSAVALAAHPDTLTDARLARLKQGYCCRRSCDSYYYNLIFAPHPSVDWRRIVGKLSDAAAPVTAEKDAHKGEHPSQSPARKRLLIKVAAGLGLVLLLLLCRHLLSGGSLPGLHRAPKYTVDPASLPAVPVR